MISRILIVPRNLANNNLFQIKKNIRRRGKTAKKGGRKKLKINNLFLTLYCMGDFTDPKQEGNKAKFSDFFLHREQQKFGKRKEFSPMGCL